MTFKIKKSSASSIFLTVIVGFALLFGMSLSAYTQQTASRAEDLVKTISGGKLQTEKKAVPYELVADFNGDKIQDVAVIVRLAETVENIGKTVKIEYPYYGEKEVSAEDLALFIIHGKGKGWQYAQKSAVLFLGRSSALIFQKDRLGESGENGNNWEIKKDKRGKSMLYFSTEASDGTLTWNGKKYVWFESEP